MAEIQALAKGLKILNLLEHSRQRHGNHRNRQASFHRQEQRLAPACIRSPTTASSNKTTDSARYQLGPQLLTLGQHLLNRITLRDHARPYLHELVDKTGECAHLAIQAQRQALYIDQVESTAALRVESEIGTLSPLHCTALGKVMLAFGRRDSMPEELRPFTHRTVTDSLHAASAVDAYCRSRIRHRRRGIQLWRALRGGAGI